MFRPRTINTDALAQATGLDGPPGCTALCTGQIDRAAAALTPGAAALARRQEARTFEDLAEKLGADPAPLIDLRDRAGWAADDAPTLPRMAVPVTEARLPTAPAQSIDILSEGACLILGAPEPALAGATQLQDHLAVTVLLAETAGIPDTRAFDIVSGRLRAATGRLAPSRSGSTRCGRRSPGRSAASVRPARRGGHALRWGAGSFGGHAALSRA